MTESPTITISELVHDPEDARYLIEHSAAALVLTDDDGALIALLLPVDDTDKYADDDEPADTELSIEDDPFGDHLDAPDGFDDTRQSEGR